MNLLRNPLLPWSLLMVSLVAHGFRGPSAPSIGEAGDAIADAAKQGLAQAPAAAMQAAATNEAEGAAPGETNRETDVEKPANAAAAAAADAAMESVRARLHGSPAATFGKALGNEDGDRVSAAWARLFVWYVDMRRELQAGDEIAALWTWDEAGLPIIDAASLHQVKTGDDLVAYRFQAPGDTWASYWTADGVEVPKRLIGGPIATYEQITSLLKDRPTHGGIDFKAPEGTPITTPRDGVVTRVNWNWKANGNCVELRLTDGTIVKLLHLSKNLVKEGQSVTKGQVVAESGNTGHSTAPHLHYQLEQNGRVIDPIDYHGTERRKLSGAALAQLQRTVAGLKTRLAGTQLAEK